MNKENILKLADHIERLDPMEYDQSKFVYGCGTPSCIAGWALWFVRPWEGRGDVVAFETGVEIAEKWLGISSSTARILFSAHPYASLDDAPSPQEAAVTLRHLAETGEVDWRATR